MESLCKKIEYEIREQIKEDSPYASWNTIESITEDRLAALAKKLAEMVKEIY